MMTLRNFLVAAVLTGTVAANSETSFITSPRWGGCNTKNYCYSLEAQDASTSGFSPSRIYARKIEFKLYENQNFKRPVKRITAESAFTNDTQNTWYLINSSHHDYIFNTNSMMLKKIEPIKRARAKRDHATSRSSRT